MGEFHPFRRPCRATGVRLNGEVIVVAWFDFPVPFREEVTEERAFSRPERDDVLHVRFVPNLLDERDEVRKCHDDFRAAVGQQVTDLPRTILRVHRDHDAAHCERPVERDDELGRVGKVDGDTVVHPDTSFLQPGREPADLRPEVFVRQLPVVGDDSQIVRLFGNRVPHRRGKIYHEQL